MDMVYAELVNSSNKILRLHVTLVSVGGQYFPRFIQIERALAGRCAAWAQKMVAVMTGKSLRPAADV
jgi:hypothetical protein